jgi:outer membrane protein assembly factor BamB
LQWRYPTGSYVYSSPAVANGVVYVGENVAKVWAVATNGCGRVLCGARWTGFTNDSIVSSSPAIADGVLYIGSGDKFYPDDQAGRLYAFSLSGQ